jgi:hypothetical protein
MLSVGSPMRPFVTHQATLLSHKRMEPLHPKSASDGRRFTQEPREQGRVPDWTLVGDRAHVVQFYEDDALLVELLSRFVGAALATGDSAVVVATQRHREALANRLRRRGFDLAVPLAQRRYLPFDAADTLQRIMRDGRPDPELFSAVMGDAIVDASKAAAGRKRIVAFGEMVALLWAGGNIDAALQIEELWNRMADEHSFSLCCAYPMSGFFGSPHAAPFLKICAQHSHVFPAERRRSTTTSD